MPHYVDAIGIGIILSYLISITDLNLPIIRLPQMTKTMSNTRVYIALASNFAVSSKANKKSLYNKNAQRLLKRYLFEYIPVDRRLVYVFVCVKLFPCKH